MKILEFKRKEQEPASKAVVASDGYDGTVLYYVGEDIAYQVEEMYGGQLCELRLDHAPPGISVWEGRYVHEKAGALNGYVSPDPEPEGTFRAPTDEEWEAIKKGNNPWAK